MRKVVSLCYTPTKSPGASPGSSEPAGHHSLGSFLAMPTPTDESGNPVVTMVILTKKAKRSDVDRLAAGLHNHPWCEQSPVCFPVIIESDSAVKSTVRQARGPALVDKGIEGYESAKNLTRADYEREDGVGSGSPGSGSPGSGPGSRSPGSGPGSRPGTKKTLSPSIQRRSLFAVDPKHLDLEDGHGLVFHPDGRLHLERTLGEEGAVKKHSKRTSKSIGEGGLDMDNEVDGGGSKAKRNTVSAVPVKQGG